jgi:hypothetical protein
VRLRKVERVEHWEELDHQSLRGASRLLLLLADHALAVVVEVGLQPLERAEVFVALGH